MAHRRVLIIDDEDAIREVAKICLELAACPSNTGERLLRVGWRPIHREEIRLSKTFRPYQPDQMLLMPVALQEWLPPDHLAYFISDVVDQLDLGEIESRYKQEERGYPPTIP